MSVPVSFDDLLAAYEWVSAGEVAALDCEAYVSREQQARSIGAARELMKNLWKIFKTEACTSPCRVRTSSISVVRLPFASWKSKSLALAKRSTGSFASRVHIRTSNRCLHMLASSMPGMLTNRRPSRMLFANGVKKMASGSSASPPRPAPNPSIERTSSSVLCTLPAAAHVQR